LNNENENYTNLTIVIILIIAITNIYLKICHFLKDFTIIHPILYKSHDTQEQSRSRIGERKWGGDFRRKMMMFESMIETWGWKEEEEVVKNARKTFERGAWCGHTNVRLHSEGRVQEE
jgi:hypothetical protein